MLFQDRFGGQRTRADGGDAAESVRDARFSDLQAKRLDGSVRKKLEHERLSESEGEIVDPDMDLIDTGDRDDLIDRGRRLRRLEQQKRLRSSADKSDEFLDLEGSLEEREHNDIGAGLDDRVDLFFRGTVFIGRLVDRVHADEKIGLRQHCPDIPDVFDGVVILDGIEPALTQFLADIFHVDKDPVDARVLRDKSDVRSFRYVHQFQSHLPNLFI